MTSWNNLSPMAVVNMIFLYNVIVWRLRTKVNFFSVNYFFRELETWICFHQPHHGQFMYMPWHQIGFFQLFHFEFLSMPWHQKVFLLLCHGELVYISWQHKDFLKLYNGEFLYMPWHQRIFLQLCHGQLLYLPWRPTVFHQPQKFINPLPDKNSTSFISLLHNIIFPLFHEWNSQSLLWYVRNVQWFSEQMRFEFSTSLFNYFEKLFLMTCVRCLLKTFRLNLEKRVLLCTFNMSLVIIVCQ